MRPEHLPPALRELTEGSTWERITVGRSGAAVYRLTSGARTLFLKVSPDGESTEIRREAELLAWLNDASMAPAVIYHESTPQRDFLLTAGLTGHDLEGDEPPPRETAIECAAVLRRLHALPIAHCPFDGRLRVKLELARLRVERGLVDEDDFDPERRGRSAREVFEEILRLRPSSEEAVFTHGDFTPANILFDGPRFSGLVDWGRAGVADRYQDLALFCRSLPTPELKECFLSAYGIESPDRERLEFYRLLDELF